ncbi:MAG: FecR domain-containing protein [Patescibacteria group bacterium]
MYQQQKNSYNRRAGGSGKAAMDYVMPFLILICIGVVGILGFKLWKVFFGEENAKAAYLHLVEGTAEMKAWGTDDFFAISGDSLVMQGDEIRSSSDAKIIVEFTGGTIMRMDANTEVSFDLMESDDESQTFDLKLLDGAVWFNLAHRDAAGDLELTVNTENLVVHSNQASTFEVQAGDEEATRVLSVYDNEGLLVDILSKDKENVVESENIGIGQQIVFNQAVLDKYWAYQAPTVLAALDPEFQGSAWYLWNLKEDNAPTKFQRTADGTGFIRVEPEVTGVASGEEATMSGVVSGAVVPSGQTPSAQPSAAVSGQPSGATSSTLKSPTVVSVAGVTKVDAQGKYQSKSRVTTLTGNVSGAEKVTVNGYTLTKFKPGDTTWSYFANADFGLMKAGDNTYEVIAYDAAGTKSSSLVIKVFYEPQGPVVAPASSGQASGASSGGTTSGTTSAQPSGGTSSGAASGTTEDADVVNPGISGAVTE